MACSQIDGPIEASIIIRKALLQLNAREERVIRLRYGIGIGAGLTFGEIGNEFGLSIERVRQIHHKAFRQLTRQLTKPKYVSSVRRLSPSRRVDPELAQRRTLARELAKQREKQRLLDLEESVRKFKQAEQEAAASELAKLTACGQIIERHRRRLARIIKSVLHDIPEAPMVSARIRKGTYECTMAVQANRFSDLVKRIHAAMKLLHVSLVRDGAHIEDPIANLRQENGEVVLSVTIRRVQYWD